MRVRTDLVPLSDRLAALQGARLLIAAAVMATVVLVPTAIDERGTALVPLCVIWVGGTAGLEAVRRVLHHRALLLLSTLLLVDGLVLAIVVAETGGAQSPLLFVIHLHVLACTLLASPRSGLSMGAWHGLLFVTAQHVSWWDAPTTRSGPTLTVAALSFVLVAAAAALFASLNERALRRSRRSAGTLVELGDDLERCHTLDDVAGAAVVHFVGRLGATRAAMLVYGPDGCSGAATAGTTPIPIRTRAADIDPEENGPRLAALLSSPRDWLLSTVLPDASNVVIVPLEADGAGLGVVAVEFGPERPALPRDELALIEQSVARVGLSARAGLLLAEVESLATTDPLTGLPNRRLFDDTLEREIARARRSGTPLAVAMLDVDHFKVVNDRHGHQVGDEVLRQLARALENAARRESLIARYGGEEFVVLLPDATAADAVVAAERMREAAADVGAVAVTVSVGVAARDDDESPEELLAAADAALYEAKRRGRDRVVSHDDVPQPESHGRPTISATEGGAGP